MPRCTRCTLGAVAPYVVTYTAVEEEDVSPVALGVFIQEATGWKFEVSGQGYGSALAGLITSYGVEVADADGSAVLSGPVPLTGVVKMPGQAPPEERAYVPGLNPPPERPYQLVEDGEFGPVFEPFIPEGHGNRVVTVDAGLPSGPVSSRSRTRARGTSPSVRSTSATRTRSMTSPYHCPTCGAAGPFTRPRGGR